MSEATITQRWDLYHRIADKDCAQTRLLLSKTAAAAKGQIRFRNVDTGAEALSDLKVKTGSDRVPMLHDRVSGQIYLGKDAIEQLSLTI